MMYTFLFTFINPNTGKEDQTEYCAETDKEAIEGFQDFCADEGFGTVPDYDMEIVYNREDADYYGMNYGYPDEQKDKMCNTCIFCSYEEKKEGLYCHHQKSENYGKKLSLADAKKFCKDHCPHNYEISLKEALRQTISPESYNDVYYHRILPSGKDAKAYAIIEFSSNEELERWKDGHVRLFKEYVDLRVSDGEIQVAHTEEQDND